MITIKDYTTQIQTNMYERDTQKEVLSVPYLQPFPSPEKEGGFARKNVYFFFGSPEGEAMKTVRKHLLKQAVQNRLRVLIQDAGYTAYEDIQLLLEEAKPANSSILMDIILNRRKEAAEGLNKLAAADLNWLKRSSLEFPHIVAVKNYFEKAAPYDMLLVCISYQELLSEPDFVQELAQKTNSAVIVFVETEADVINSPHPLRPFQQLGNLEKFAAEFNFLSDTSDTEETAQGDYRDLTLIKVVSYAKSYSYFAVCKEYHAHDGILEWYVREAE
ncbi:MAG: hypothetical protein Q4P84_07335 [Elusimicrobiales bacterium]|nr:hypothetical protein [Elusimicrobiales bacterium]